MEVTQTPCLSFPFSLLVLEDIIQASDMWQNLDHKLITVMQKLLGLAGKPNAGRGASDNDSAFGQSRTLGEEANNLRNRKDQVPLSLSVHAQNRLWNPNQHIRQRTFLHNLPILQPT